MAKKNPSQFGFFFYVYQSPGSLSARRGGRRVSSRTFHSSIIEIVRTIFAAASGEEIPPQKF